MSGYEKEKNLFYHIIIWTRSSFPLKKEAARDDDGGTSYRVSRRASSIFLVKIRFLE